MSDSDNQMLLGEKEVKVTRGAEGLLERKFSAHRSRIVLDLFSEKANFKAFQFFIFVLFPCVCLPVCLCSLLCWRYAAEEME